MKVLIILCLIFHLKETISLTLGQSTYTIDHDHVDLEDYNKEYVTDLTAYVAQYNESLKILGGSGNLLKPIDRKWMSHVQVYVYENNEYVIYPLNVSIPVCTVLKMNIAGVKKFVKYLFGVESCPLNPGNYSITNIVIDEELLPAGIPFGKYKIASRMTIGKTEIGRGAWYGAVLPKPKVEN